MPPPSAECGFVRPCETHGSAHDLRERRSHLCATGFADDARFFAVFSGQRRRSQQRQRHPAGTARARPGKINHAHAKALPESEKLGSARTCPRFRTGRQVCQSESGDVSLHSPKIGPTRDVLDGTLCAGELPVGRVSPSAPRKLKPRRAGTDAPDRISCQSG